MTSVAVTHDGLAQFRRELRELDRLWPRELTKVHKAISLLVEPVAVGMAKSRGGMQRHFADQILARATQSQAGIGVRQIANAAFWGSAKHTGWYAGKEGRPQFPPWVGASWQAGEPGQGPYAINDAVAASKPLIDRAYELMLDELSRRAFPDR